MGARITKSESGRPAPSAAQIEEQFRAEGLDPRRWGNAAGDRYGWHSHAYRKVLCCTSGSITFHISDDADLELHPGDRLDIEPGTDHAATVGPDGVECVEASR